MKYTEHFISYGKEVPGVITLCFKISGCPRKCEGCHSPELQEDIGTELTVRLYKEIIRDCKAPIAGVLFLGGDQFEHKLFNLLVHTPSRLIKCVYSGAEGIPNSLVEQCDFYKVGPYNGIPITDRRTNQRFRENSRLGNRLTDLTYLFWED
jgi:anaerobic ribonucleoside-triphosphate reductase activating protein